MDDDGTKYYLFRYILIIIVFRRVMMAQSDKLDKLIAKARDHKMSPDERKQQRVSLVMGLRGHRSTLTKEKVETLLEGVD